MMVQDMKLVAIVLILAALVYILYLWSKRKDQISCPSCGARVNIYAEECPHCGHQKGEPVEDEAATDVVGQEADTGVSAAAPDTEQRSEQPSGPEEPDEPVPEPDTPSPAEASEAAADVDYEEIVQGTIAEVKEEIREHDLDPQKVLKAEKENKDRVTLTDWLEEQLAQQ